MTYNNAEYNRFDRSGRHYGLLVGDVVEQRTSLGTLRGTVIRLQGMDNNGAMVRLDDGLEIKVVCEWCYIISRPEI